MASTPLLANEWIEMPSSRARSYENGIILTETLDFIVNALPEVAYRLATPSLPTIGSPLALVSSIDVGLVYAPGVQLRKVEPTPIPNSLMTLMRLFYSSGPDISGGDSDHPVLWDVDTRLLTETVDQGLATEAPGGIGPPIPALIPGGATRYVPAVVHRATMMGGNVTNAMTQKVGSVNSEQFHNWPPHTLLYLGVSSELIAGSDTESLTAVHGNGIVTLSFMGKLQGWEHVVALKDANTGRPTGETQHFVIYTEYRFQDLFPSGWRTGG